MALLLKAITCCNEGRAPIWLMRQAGRYLPQYQEVRANHRLLDLFHDPDKIVTITKQPVDILGVDAAILFSDILTVLDGMGIDYNFCDKSGPLISPYPEVIVHKHPEEAYSHIRKAIHALKKELKVPLIGFAGAPFTIASYMIEQKSSRDLRKTKQFLFQNPSQFEQLLEEITSATVTYLKYQIESGVDVIQLFDSWANVLGYHEFDRYSLRPMRKILEALRSYSVPTILFCRGSSFFAEELAKLSPHAISLDWSCDMSRIREKIPKTVAIQGNLDPMLLYGSKETIKTSVDRLLNAMRGDPGYIFNLGHGLLPDIPYQNVHYLVDYVRAASL